MNDLFVHQLQDIYYAGKQLVKALPRRQSARGESSRAAPFRSKHATYKRGRRYAARGLTTV